MKFIACGDLHISEKMPYSNKGQDRCYELLSAWNQVCIEARRQQIRHIVITGDIFDDINVSPRAMEVFDTIVNQSSDITKIIVSGNHEIDEEGNSVIKSIAHMARHLNLISPSPCEKNTVVHFRNDTDLFLFDYHHSYQELKASIRESLRMSDAEYKIFIGHQPIEGMEMREAKFCTHGLPKKWFEKKGIIEKNFDLVLMGDFHRMQILKGKVEGYYTGSLIQNSFRDEGSTPGFLIVNLDGEYSTEVKIVPIRCPQFHTVRFIEGKPEPDLRYLTKGGYIKITIIGTQKYVDSINIRRINDEIIGKYEPIKVLLSNPTITCSIPEIKDMTVSRLMSDGELVEKIISTDEESTLPDKLLYDVGIKYLKQAKT
jgi:DNA repair exonuclease SbcCD nuclease subunit